MRAKFPIQLAKELIILSAYSEAINLLRPEAELGHAEAQFLYGFLHFLNPDLSSSDAIQMIQNAAQQGHADACYVLATVHDFDAGYQFEMPRTEQQWQMLRFASRQGSIAAKIMHAQAYEDGVFMPLNLRAAHHLLKQCVQRGSLIHAEASYRLGALLLNYPELQVIRGGTSAWFLLCIMSHQSDDYEVIVKARHLVAERGRIERYKPERKDILIAIREMNRSFRHLTPMPPRPTWMRFLNDYCRRTLVYDLRRANFEEFVSFLFDHPLRENDGQRWETNWEFIASIKVGHHAIAQHYTRLFHEPAFLLDHYTPEEIEQGFWFAKGNVGSVLAHQGVSAQEVEACFHAMYDLFAKLFMLPQIADISNAAHMWWDSNFYVAKRYEYDRIIKQEYRRDDEATIQHFREVILDVLARTLQLDSIACKAHALHGLGHLNHPGKEQVIRDFLIANPDLPDFDGWYQYGMAAIEGKVM